MNFQSFSRRNFLIAAAGTISFFLPLSACKQNGTKGTRAGVFSSADSDIIHKFIERLLPVEGIDNSVFSDITTGLLNSAENDVGLRESLKSCIQSLQDLTQNNWLNTEPQKQIAMLKQLETEAWFLDISIRAKGAMFYNPNLWKLINYTGPSFEDGGYKYNGFDDIDWLPKGVK